MPTDNENNINSIDADSIGKYVNIDGHKYVIKSISSNIYGPNSCNRMKLLSLPEDDDTPSEDDKLVELVRTFRRDSIGKGKITLFKRKKYIQAVINLAEGLPASSVAEALDDAAEYVRNQDVVGNWDE